jgi:hypothetical protein
MVVAVRRGDLRRQFRLPGDAGTAAKDGLTRVARRPPFTRARVVPQVVTDT